MQQHKSATEFTKDTEFWGNVAKKYNSMGNLGTLLAVEALRLLNLTDQDRFVLDVAAGTGNFALQAARELKRLHPQGGAQVLATDFAEAMLGACKFEVDQQGLGDIIQCKLMDAQDLGEIKDGSVDAVGCVLGAMFFPDAVKAFRHIYFLLHLLWEMHRVLREGGRAAIVVLHKVATVSLMTELCARLDASDQRPPLDLAQAAYKLADADFFRAQLNQAGFAGDHVVSITKFEGDWTGLEVDNVVGWVLDNPVVSQRYSERRDEVEATLRQLLTDPGSPFYIHTKWQNQTLIALVQK